VVVLSYGLWQRRFGASQNVIGSSIVLDGEPFTVIASGRRLRIHPGGCMGADCAVVARADEPEQSLRRLGDRPTKPGVTKRQVKAEMNTIAARLSRRTQTQIAA